MARPAVTPNLRTNCFKVYFSKDVGISLCATLDCLCALCDEPRFWFDDRREVHAGYEKAAPKSGLKLGRGLVLASALGERHRVYWVAFTRSHAAVNLAKSSPISLICSPLPKRSGGIITIGFCKTSSGRLS